MKTDWELIRTMMNTAIDSCQQIEAMGYSEQHRSTLISAGEQRVSVWDFLVSTWTYPETAMAQACAELVGAAQTAPANDAVRAMIDWYQAYAVPGLRQAIAPAASE